MANPSTGAFIYTLVTGMLAAGACNSLLSKYQDRQCVGNCDSRPRFFEQPLLQTLNMFLGEMLCLLAFSILSSRFNPYRAISARRSALIATAKRAAENHDTAGPEMALEGTAIVVRGWKKATLFWLPSICDILGTTCMNVGLIFVPVSVYQMLRGALVLWVGLFSVIFLKRKLVRAQLVALFTVVAGVAIVGLSSITAKVPASLVEEEAGVSAAFGILLVLGAQIFTASQFVLEEKIMERYAVEPLAAVGYEGLFGTLTTLVIIPVMYFWLGNTKEGRGGYFDTVTGFHQMLDNPAILGSSIAIAVSIAIFNFCGLGVTRAVSATARSTIDTCRTVAIWAVSLLLGWESFRFLQIIGFVLLVYGTLVFNGLVRFPDWTNIHSLEIPPILLVSDDEEEDVIPGGRRVRGEAAPLLREE